MSCLPTSVEPVKLNLRTRQIECYDYTQCTNPPVLHRKETFLHPENELHAKFARLTAQEEKHRLLDAPAGIGTRDGWARRLSERGFALKGHRLLKGRSNGEGASSPTEGAGEASSAESAYSPSPVARREVK